MGISTKLTLYPASQRGKINMGWLEARHSFSFGSYFDPAKMGFGPLKVINEDRIQASSGFPTHGHRNMEIVTYVISGTISHRDSTGGEGTIRAGEVQLMRAGRGIHHSEMNESPDERLHLLQIWIEPKTFDTEPGYMQRDFGRQEGITLLLSPNGQDNSLAIDQEMRLYRGIFSEGKTKLDISGSKTWIQVVSGELEISGTKAETGDGMAIENITELQLNKMNNVEVLIFDMN